MNRNFGKIKFGKKNFIVFLILNVSLFIVFLSLYFFNVTELQNLYFISITFFMLVNIFSLNYLGFNYNSNLQRIYKVLHKIRNQKVLENEQVDLSDELKLIEIELKKLIRKNKDSKKRLKKLEIMRSRFLGNVSHEIRTPLFAIQGYLETLLNGALDNPKVNRKFLTNAYRQVKNLDELLNDLIDISMLESGEMKLKPEEFFAHEIFDDLLEYFAPMVSKKNLKLNVEYSKNEQKIYGDRKRLKQVFVNLIQNAIKYTEMGSVTIVLDETEEFVVIRIVDTGIGIASINHKKIFERFFRVDKDRSKKVGGTGLGLAIVKHIIKAHKAEICLKSKLGEGSEFQIKLRKKLNF